MKFAAPPTPRYVSCLAAVLLGVLASCGPTETPVQRHVEANTPAGKAGKVAHEVVKEAGKAAAVAGRELKKSAHEAREGWKEAAREDKAKSSK